MYSHFLNFNTANVPNMADQTMQIVVGYKLDQCQKNKTVPKLHFSTKKIFLRSL